MSEIKTFGSHLVNMDMIPLENAVFVDVGACVGNFTADILKMKTIDPMIFALEPNRDNYMTFRETYGQYKYMHTKEAALVGSKEPKTMLFAQFDGLPEWGNVSGLYTNRKHVNYEVQTITIREVLDQIEIDRPIHHLKMDIEGCEHGVIADLTTTDAKRIQQISLEVHNGLQGMLEHLTKIGYDTKFENGELYAVTTW